MLIFSVETTLFYRYISHDIIHYYPRGFDQTSYLPLIYTIYQNLKSQGFIVGLINSPTLPTGILFPLEHALVMYLVGPGRSTALLLNFSYFIILQICVVYAVKQLTKKWSYAFILLGLLISLKTPYHLVGGMTDVRMDFIAFALYGIFVTCVIRSNLFADAKWTFLSTVIAVLLILSRFITAVYLSGVYFLFTVYLFFSKKSALIRFRLKHIIWADVIIASLIAVYVWLNQAILFQYYGIGHYFGEEKYLRAHEHSIYTFWDNLWFYPRNIFHDHLGTLPKSYLYVLFFIGLVFIFYRVIFRKLNFNSNLLFKDKESIIFLLISVLVPLMVLTLDANKSLVVAGITMGPILWLVLFVLIYGMEMVRNSTRGKNNYAIGLTLLTFFIVIMGFKHQYAYLSRRVSSEQQVQLQQLTNVYLAIGNYAQSQQWPLIKISFTEIQDYLNRGILQTLYFEKRGVFLTTETMLARGLFSVNSQEASELLRHSNVIVLSKQKNNHALTYPFDASIQKLHTDLSMLTKQNFKLLLSFDFDRLPYEVYVRA